MAGAHPSRKEESQFGCHVESRKRWYGREYKLDAPSLRDLSITAESIGVIGVKLMDLDPWSSVTRAILRQLVYNGNRNRK